LDFFFGCAAGLSYIARDRPDIIPVESFQKILIKMGLPLEKAEESKKPE